MSEVRPYDEHKQDTEHSEGTINWHSLCLTVKVDVICENTCILTYIKILIYIIILVINGSINALTFRWRVSMSHHTEKFLFVFPIQTWHASRDSRICMMSIYEQIHEDRVEQNRAYSDQDSCHITIRHQRWGLMVTVKRTSATKWKGWYLSLHTPENPWLFG